MVSIKSLIFGGFMFSAAVSATVIARTPGVPLSSKEIFARQECGFSNVQSVNCADCPDSFYNCVCPDEDVCNCQCKPPCSEVNCSIFE